MPVPEAIERHLTGEYKHGVVGACCNAPCACLLYCFAPNCMVWVQRKRLLRITGERYVCCGGLWPCCGFQSPKPECCLICEAAFCCPLANSGCVDKVAVALHCCVGIGCSCARICCDCSEERENIVKSSICVLPASLCQNAAEMNYRAETNQRYLGPPRGVVEELPVHFHNAGVVAQVPTQHTMKQ